MTGTKQHYVIKPGILAGSCVECTQVQQVEGSMTESKPAPEFVMHQVPVFDTYKNHRVPGITAQNIRKGSLSESYAADTSRKPMNRHTDIHKKV